jgi:hypothetical protein
MEPAEVVSTAVQPHPGGQDSMHTVDSMPSGHQWHLRRTEGGGLKADCTGEHYIVVPPLARAVYDR